MATYYGDNNNNTYNGTNADDNIYGYDGDDTLNGSGGDDWIYGGNGNDTLNGGAGNDTILDGNGDDILDGGAGYDHMEGGGGADTYLISKNDGHDGIFDSDGLNTNAADVVKFTNVASTDITAVIHDVPNYGVVIHYAGGNAVEVYDYFTYINYSSLKFQFSDLVSWGWIDITQKVLEYAASNGDDILSGYDNTNDLLNGLAGNDTLYGFSGNDTLNGGAGDDDLEGGTGNDTYLIAKNDGKDTIIDVAGADTVTFTGMAYSDITLVSRVSNDLLLTYGSNSQLTVKSYFITGADSIDQFQFINGINWSKNDIYQRFIVQGTAGNDLLYGFENSNDTINGLGGSDTLIGLSGNDTLNGGDGNDNLRGDAGDDVLNGGNGIDWAQYWNATSAVTVSLGLVTAQNTVGAGTDTLGNIENLNGSSFGDTLTGNAGANWLYGLNGNDTLNGADGNDKLLGGTGDDALNGGNGIDEAMYWSALAGVKVNLGLSGAQNTLNAGTDTLINIENLSGSNYGDTLVGNSSANSLFGRAGNDVLNGSLGNDVLSGGLGKDVFIFNTALSVKNQDTITDFSVADDTIKLENSVFTALGVSGPLTANAFKIIGNGNAVDNDDHVLYNTATGGLFYDADGNGAMAAVQIAFIGTNLALTPIDFVVI